MCKDLRFFKCKNNHEWCVKVSTMGLSNDYQWCPWCGEKTKENKTD